MYNTFYDYLKDDFNADEVLHFFSGELIGVGANRRVFVNAMNTDTVIKFEYTDRTFMNIFEWDVYHNLPEQYLPYFAKPIRISNNGRMLIQEKTLPPLNYPEYIPAIFGDTKLTNFGVTLDGRFVCHDYGNIHLFVPNVLTEKVKFKKAKWWSLEEHKHKILSE